MTDAVHAKGGVISCQLWHTGRVAHSKYRAVPVVAADPVRLPPVGPSDVPMAGRDELPRPLTGDDIQRVIGDYVHSAKLAIHTAGFDLVEVHGAHGYLLDQFFNSVVNTRSDAYGGSVENRARFLFDVIDAVQAAVGKDRVAVRISPHTPETMKFNGVDDANPLQVYDHVFEKLDTKNLAYVLLTEPRWRGGGTDGGAADPGMQMPLTFAPRYKPRYRGVLIGAGGFTPSNGKAAISDGHVDAVAFGRWFISNPDIVERLRTGAPFNVYNRATFYVAPGVDTLSAQSAVGYTDYPRLGEPLGNHTTVEQAAIGAPAKI